MSLTGETSAPRIPLLVILGPTASGKTALAVELAAHLHGEIIGADSRQIYRYMDIGTAKPTPEERRAAPHHLIDIVDPDQTLTAAEYADLAHAAVRDIAARGHLPMLVGGTGQYLAAVLEGWQAPRIPPDAALRAELEGIGAEHGPEALHARLCELDPASAQAIDPRNQRRIIRALEVTMLTGQPFSAQRQAVPPPYQAHLIGLNMARERLYRRADARIDQMMEAGLLAEVQALLARGYSPDLPAMSGLGYQQLVRHLLDGQPLADSVADIRRGTRRFIRHQDTWFRRFGDRVVWYNSETPAAESVLVDLRQRLEKP